MEEAARRRACIKEKRDKMWRDISTEQLKCDKLWADANIKKAKQCQAFVSRLMAVQEELRKEQREIERRLGI